MSFSTAVASSNQRNGFLSGRESLRSNLSPCILFSQGMAADNKSPPTKDNKDNFRLPRRCGKGRDPPPFFQYQNVSVYGFNKVRRPKPTAAPVISLQNLLRI
jgi:hypothetical protein